MMVKHLALCLFFIGASFYSNGAKAAKGMFKVDHFGKLSIDGSEVDFDHVHLNLRRFEEYASSKVAPVRSTNNIAVGAITIFFGEEDESSSSSQIKGAKTFYLETSSQGADRKLLVFESTPGKGEEEVKWERSGLGCLEGHSMMVCQPSSIKSLCFKKMHTFFQQMSSQEYDESDSPLHPLLKMREPLGLLTKIAGALRKKREELCRTLAPLGQLGDAYKQLFYEESNQEDKMFGFDALSMEENLVNEEDATSAKDYVFNNNALTTVKGMEERIDSLKESLRDIPTQLKEFKELLKEVEKNATNVYNKCWHSEQRLFHFLFSNLTESSLTDEEESSISGSSRNNTPALNPDETTFNWDALTNLGDDLDPKVVFFHIHSRLNFCDMCRYTLADIIPKLLMRNVTSFPSNWRLGGVLGSYRVAYDKSSLDEEPGTTPWLEERSYSLSTLEEKLEEHRSEDEIPSLYIWKML
jgi:hypothetical protein